MSTIREIVMAEPLFDCHEHQNGFTMLQDAKPRIDYRCFLGYASADLATAGGVAPQDLSTPEAFFNAWQFCRTTGYGQATEMACEAVLDIPFRRENVDEINTRLGDYVSKRTGREIYEDLFSRANIRWVMTDACWDSPTKLHFFTGREHPSGFRHALRCDALIAATSRDGVRNLEKLTNRSIQSLQQFDRALDAYAELAREGGCMGAFKCGVAYNGALCFENSSYALAEPAFEDILQGRPTDPRPLHSYLLHRLVQRAGEFGLPLQIHTGYLAGNWGNPTQGDPAGLIPLFQRYRNVRFDLFHAGWPFSDLMGAIGKSFPNVYLDLCWAWSMAPNSIERILGEWLSTVPCNKIFAFGGDTGQPFAALGYAMQARRGVANVLEQKLSTGEYDLATATMVAKRLLHQNALDLYPVATPASQPAAQLKPVSV